MAIFWTSVPAVTTSSYRSAEPELLFWRQSFLFGTDVVHQVWLTGQELAEKGVYLPANKNVYFTQSRNH